MRIGAGALNPGSFLPVTLAMLDHPLIINLAPTGAVADHEKNPNVPITLEAVVADVMACADLGASIAHLHVRNPDGTPSCDPGLFAALIERLRDQPAGHELVLCATTSGRHGQTREQRAAVLNLPTGLRPEMASLTLGSLNFVSGASVNAPDTIRFLVDQMNENGVKPELEIFDIGMIEFAKTLIGEGRLTAPYYCNLILGNIGGLPATAQYLGFAMSILPDHSVVSIGGIGRHQAAANALGVAAAHGVRIGLEDNLWADWKAKTPADNPSLVNALATVARALNREISSPTQTRELLGIKPRS